MKQLILFLSLFPFSLLSYNSDEVAIGLGFSSFSYSEAESNLTGPNVEKAFSGSFSLLTVHPYWKFKSWNKLSLFLEGAFPLMTSESNSYFSFGTGVEYYFSDENNIIRERKRQFYLEIDPKLRYYARAGFAAGFLTYNTGTEVKRDSNIEISLGGGAVYTLSKKYGLKGDFILGRGIGAKTSSINVRIFGSFVYYID